MNGQTYLISKGKTMEVKVMSGKVAVCSVCPKKNQQIEAVIKLPEERRAVIHGTVLDANGNPVADAVVKLLQIVDCCKLPVPLTHTFTDQYGQFFKRHLFLQADVDRGQGPTRTKAGFQPLGTFTQ